MSNIMDRSEARFQDGADFKFYCEQELEKYLVNMMRQMGVVLEGFPVLGHKEIAQAIQKHGVHSLVTKAYCFAVWYAPDNLIEKSADGISMGALFANSYAGIRSWNSSEYRVTTKDNPWVVKEWPMEDYFNARLLKEWRDRCRRVITQKVRVYPRVSGKTMRTEKTLFHLVEKVGKTKKVTGWVSTVNFHGWLLENEKTNSSITA